MSSGDSNPSCPRLGSCELFPLLSTSGFLKVWQINYCEADFSRCARYGRSCRGEHVSPTLLPNGQSLSKPLK